MELTEPVKAIYEEFNGQEVQLVQYEALGISIATLLGTVASFCRKMRMYEEHEELNQSSSVREGHYRRAPEPDI